jgi:AcrR family transcriptional regulator
MLKHGPETRRQILRAALKRFADAGYAAASVQQIVDDAKVSKPALYYHFADKAGLFQALVHEAHDQRYRVLQEATARGGDFRQQAEAILTGLFAYFRQNRELMRIAFATMFAAPGEIPETSTTSASASAILSWCTTSSSAPRKTASWTNGSRARNSRSVFTGWQIFTSSRTSFARIPNRMNGRRRRLWSCSSPARHRKNGAGRNTF